MPQEARSTARNTPGRRPIRAGRWIAIFFVTAVLTALGSLGYLSMTIIQLLEEQEESEARLALLVASREVENELARQFAAFALLASSTASTSTPPATDLFAKTESFVALRFFEAASGRVWWEVKSPFLDWQGDIWSAVPSEWIPYRDGSIAFDGQRNILFARLLLEEGMVFEGAATLLPISERLAVLAQEVGVASIVVLGPDGKSVIETPRPRSSALPPLVTSMQMPLTLPSFSLSITPQVSLAAQIADTFRLQAASILLVTSLLLVGGFFLLQKYVLDPLTRFVRVAREIGKGNLSVEVPTASSVELAALSDAFQRMIAHMRKYNEELVQRLRRTIEEQDKAARLLLRRDLELQEANERMRRLDQQKSEFVSIAAHQLRTPLSAIRWALSLLLNGDYGPLTDAQRSVLERAQASNAQMIALVNDLLDVDRIESGRTQFTLKKVDICRLLDDEVRNHLANAQEHGVVLRLAIGVSPCPEARLDPAHFQHVLRNIVENAIKYTPRGGKVDVSLKPSEDPSFILIEVADTGIGIPKEAQKHLFTRFFRAKNAMLQQTEGSGLGLYLVKRILEQMHCSVTVESQEGKGTRVIIHVPVMAGDSSS